jgi:hypothetical protein
MSVREVSDWDWDLKWRRNLFKWELVILGWSNDSSSIYSAKSAYNFLHLRTNVVDERSEEIVRLLSRVWETWSPLKVIVLFWQLLKDKILTRQNIFSRRIIVDLGGISCVFCNEYVESVSHLFHSFPFLGQVRYHVFRWLGWEFVLPSDLASNFSFMFELVLGGWEVGFLINLTNSCVILVEISKRSHFFGGRRHMCSS